MTIESVITHDGEHFTITIPPASMQRYGLQVGDTIAFVPLRREARHSLRSEVQVALDDIISTDRDAFEHLTECDGDRSRTSA